MSKSLLISVMTNLDQARELAIEVKGRLIADERVEAKPDPFVALVLGTTNNLEMMVEKSNVGAYLAHERIFKTRGNDVDDHILKSVTGVFTVVANSDLGHQKADKYWCDVHAPLALSIHSAMCGYTQLSIQRRFHGPQWDGFALCEFESLGDFKDHFYDSEAGRLAIAKDIAVFSDSNKSPRRIIATETAYF